MTEPAQRAAKTSSLFSELIGLLARDSFNSRPLLGYICPLLNYSLEECKKLTYPEYSSSATLNTSLAPDVSHCPDDSISTLLRIASEPEIDVEDLTSLVNTIVLLLEFERFQKLLIAEDMVTVPLLIIIQSVSPQVTSRSLLSVTNLNPPVRDSEEEEQLSAVRSALIRALSDVSSIPEFGRQYPIGSSLFDSLLVWLSSSEPAFQTCACIMLGNLARSDAVCSTMVQDLRLHETLATIFSNSSDIQVLHSVLGFLRNLALPVENKAPMGAAGIIETISRIWSMEFSPQLQYVAVGLLRQLLNGSMANVQRFLLPLSLDPDSPAHEKTFLSLLLSLFEKTDQMPTKLEIARTTASIWRCLNNADQSSEYDDLNLTIRKLFSKHPSVTAPLAMMVSQSRWPVLRSEGWFALALMARSKHGTAAINRMLTRVEVFGALVETITGQSIAAEAENSIIVPEPVTDEDELGSEPIQPGLKPKQKEEMKLRDRENAMVLISELLKNSVRLAFLDSNVCLDVTPF